MPSTTPATSVASLLRGTPATRPSRDVTSVKRVRDALETAFSVTTASPDSPLVIRAASLRAPVPTLQSSPIGRIRGLLVQVALNLLVSGYCIDDAYHDTVSAWRASGPRAETLQALKALDADQQARLASDVRSHVTVLQEHLGTIPSSWRPRTNVRTVSTLANGRVVLRDEIDLVVGTATSALASLALLDVTTAPLSGENERTLAYHAVSHTLRSGVVPLRTALLSTATGELWLRDVTTELLDAAVDDLLAFHESMAEAA